MRVCAQSHPQKRFLLVPGQEGLAPTWCRCHDVSRVSCGPLHIILSSHTESWWRYDTNGWESLQSSRGGGDGDFLKATANGCRRLGADEVARCMGENGDIHVCRHLEWRLSRIVRPAGRIRPLNGVAILRFSPLPVAGRPQLSPRRWWPLMQRRKTFEGEQQGDSRP